MFGFGSGSGGDKKEEPKSSSSKDSKNASSSSKSSSSSSGASVHGFDPTGLERAAKAAKDLDTSRNAKDALRIINTQELTKQKEAEAERAKYLVIKEQEALRRIQEEEQAAARTLEKQTQHDKHRSDYKDQLERKRMTDQINAQRYLQEEERKKQEDSLKRQEEIRRKTLEYEAELRLQTEMARVKAEAEGRILQERSNHDLAKENKKLEAIEFRETVLESIKLATSSIGDGIKDFISDERKLANTVGSMSLLAFGIYSAKVSTGVLGKYIESRIGKPSLVRETSRKNVIQILRSPFSTIRQALSSKTGENAIKNIVLESSLTMRLAAVAKSASNTKKNNAPFRHLLLHGPPGTGKTMFAKGLARESGLDYAILTGGDIAPLGKDAVTEIHKIFDWANTTSKGVVLFVDEADAFLRKRSTEKISEDSRNALNAFLYRTGEASKKFMIVYASNQPEQFDWAINDRIDEMVEFFLPQYDERLRMISQYIDQYLLNPPVGTKKIMVLESEKVIDMLPKFAEETDGYSGREISKLAIAWQAAAFGTDNASIDTDLMISVLEISKQTKKSKQSWLSKEEIEHLSKDNKE